MTVVNRIFHGKVMLFGEYSVMAGSDAALIPYTGASARLSFPDQKNDLRSNCILAGFSSFLKHIHTTGFIPEMDFERLSADVEKGLFLDSDIPENSGLGSSGAVCAAIYWNYQKNGASGDLPGLRKIFSAMEDYFHGSSSGVDPLGLFVDQPLVIRRQDYLLPAEDGAYLNNPAKPFLILSDTGNSTESLVKNFLKKIEKESTRNQFKSEYIPMVNHLVDQWLSGNLHMEEIIQLSKAQTRWFSDMIPETEDDCWNEGLLTGLYVLKICGSGGGGMTLGFTEKFEETKG